MGGISIAAGAVHAGTKAIQAYTTCNSGKGSCGDAVAEALLSTAAIVPGGRLIKGAASGVKSLSGASKASNTMAKACSFSGATLVLMADGSRKPIEDIRVGDEVIATDPETGEQEGKTVERVWVHHDSVVDLIVDGEVITTTEDHPFWSFTDQQFERADQLAAGERVVGADGRTFSVSGLKVDTERQALAYNLTVEGIHTYHVGQSDVLVHNTDGACGIQTPGKGAGSVPAGERDPRRLFTASEKADKLAEQGGVCAGCGNPLELGEAAGHHGIRHSDGGSTDPFNLWVLCRTCHTEIHRRLKRDRRSRSMEEDAHEP